MAHFRCALRRAFAAVLLAVLIAGPVAVRLNGQAVAEDTRQTAASSAATALDRYVAAPDPAYKYDVVSTTPGDGYTATLIDMTSQSWRTPGEVDRTLWKHWVTIIRPSFVQHTKALLFITGGSNDAPAPKSQDENLVRVAVATKSVVAEVRMIPNQPLVFGGDQKKRIEDDLVSYTWDKFMRGGDEQWPARLPMTKAAVRAMDTVVSACAKDQLTIDGFVVSGASKRGWTAWTTAAVDKRVVAIAPLVIDLLNIVPSFRHHLGVYGYYAPAVADYEELGLMERILEDSPRARELMKIEEPYEYRDRLTMPKFLVNATGDQFFLPDSWQFYYENLPGTKYMRYVPNTDHSMRGSDVWSSVAAFYNAVLTNAPLPQFTWKVEADGTIRVHTKDAPAKVTLWQATNPGARDFRLSSIGPKWRSTPLTQSAPGEFVAKVLPPPHGYTAFVVELTYPSGLAKAPFTFTTGVKVVPDVEPLRDLVK